MRYNNHIHDSDIVNHILYNYIDDCVEYMSIMMTERDYDDDKAVYF